MGVHHRKEDRNGGTCCRHATKTRTAVEVRGLMNDNSPIQA